ncbi:MAG: glycosyltransferase family 39 protein [Chloroflexi bacterium]|nr:glycosyltransferase family 39 protein [Chloroflexota bacterium]
MADSRTLSAIRNTHHPFGSRNTQHAIRYTLIALPLALYFFLALPQLDLPGLHNDEAAEAGLQAMQILNGQSISAFRDAGLNIGGRIFPLMVQDYIGALNVYLALPFFAAIGSTVIALRLYTVIVGAITIVLTFGFMREAFNSRAAFIASLLLASTPSFIFWQRQGVFVASLTGTFTIALLWSCLKWFKHRQLKWAFLIGLFCGLGLYAKLLFIWIIGGIIGAIIVINLVWWIGSWVVGWFGGLHSTFRIPHSTFGIPHSAINYFPHLLHFLFGLTLGIAPLLLYNLQTGGTIFSVGANLTTSYYGVNNLNFFENLRGRIDQYQAVIGGREHLWYLGGSFGNPGWEIASRVATLAIVLRFLLRRQNSQLPFALLLLLNFGIVQSAFTVSGIFPTHHAIFMPLLPMIVAAASEIIFDPFYEPMLTTRLTNPIGNFFTRGRYMGGIGLITDAMLVLAFCLGWLWVSDLNVVKNYHLALNKSGGLGPHTDAVYRLTDYLQTQKDKPIYAMDWGFAPQVKMLTQNKVTPQEIFGYDWEADDDFKNRLGAALDKPNALFVFHWSNETIFPRREIFDSILKERGLQVDQIAVISRRCLRW